MIEFNEYLSILNSRIKAQKENVNNAAQYVDKVREELVKAMKDRKIMDSSGQQFEEFLLEQKQLEQKTNDEIVLQL